MRLIPALLPLLALPSLGLAQDGGVSATNPETVRAALHAHGHKARLETDDSGNPMISARSGDINYVVYFYGCENGTDCLDLQFYAFFDLDQPLTADFVNQWNADWVMGKAFVDENGDPSFTFVVPGSPEMPPDYFNSVMEVWDTALSSFLDSIHWYGDAAPAQ